MLTVRTALAELGSFTSRSICGSQSFLSATGIRLASIIGEIWPFFGVLLVALG